MLELAVAPNGGYQDPPVSFKHSDHFSDLHGESLTDIGILGRAAVVSSSAECAFSAVQCNAAHDARAGPARTDAFMRL